MAFFFFLLSVKHDFPNKKLFTLRKPLLYFYFLIRYQWIWLKGYSTEKLWPKVKDFEKNYLGTTSGAATLACIHFVYKMAAQLPASSSWIHHTFLLALHVNIRCVVNVVSPVRMCTLRYILISDNFYCHHRKQHYPRAILTQIFFQI